MAGAAVPHLVQDKPLGKLKDVLCLIEETPHSGVVDWEERCLPRRPRQRERQLADPLAPDRIQKEAFVPNAHL